MLPVLLLSASCENLDNDIDRHKDGDIPFIALGDVAAILSEIPLGKEHLYEVHDAVSASSSNGYDDEYTMQNLFSFPGSGVGDSICLAKTCKYSNPLRDVINVYLCSSGKIRLKSSSEASGSDPVSAEEFIEALESSDIQIYWPFSENWDGETYPIITFDPSDGSETNIGYRIKSLNGDDREVEEVIVDEKTAIQNPVWVINRNSDAEFTSLEMLRRQDPDWGSGGGSVIVRPGNERTCMADEAPFLCRSSGYESVRTLILKEIIAKKNFDPWFSGASELFVKMGSVEDFTASTEAELKLFYPTVTDFMIVVKRDKVGVPIPFNAVLVSEWTDQLDQCAFMITEDDGGTRTSWKCSAVVKVSSKSYGFEVNLPFNTRDDIIWRGQLSRKYIEKNDNLLGHFGEMDIIFEILE